MSEQRDTLGCINTYHNVANVFTPLMDNSRANSADLKNNWKARDVIMRLAN